MAQNKSALKRYKKINEMFCKERFPSKEELAKQLGVSAKMVDVDLAAMRKDVELGYFAPIQYSKKRKGYWYSDKEYSIDNLGLTHRNVESLRAALVLLNRYKELPILNPYKQVMEKIEALHQVNLISETEEMARIIQVEFLSGNAGIKYISDIFGAIRFRTNVELLYKSISKESAVATLVSPYVLKEYNGQWYLTGFHHAGNRIATFALDRVLSVTLNNSKYVRYHTFNAASYFENSIGITVINGFKPVKVILSFTSLQGAYIKERPIHSSQRIIKETNSILKIELHVIITQELITKILSYGKGVQVVSPQSLKQMIKENLQAALRSYG